MSKRHWIPHPMVGNDDKTKKMFLEDLVKEWETLQDYVAHSPNPRWAASHLVRAIALGLDKHDMAAGSTLRELANQLSSKQGDKSS